MIDVADTEAPSWSFRNQCELWVLRAMRRNHRVLLQQIRQALDEIQARTRAERPLIDYELLFDGRSIVYEHFGQLFDAGQRGQELFTAVRPLLDRVEWQEEDVARLFPIATDDLDHDGRRIVMDTRLAFGRACLIGNGVPVEVFAPRFLAGETVEDLAQEFSCTVDEVQDALRFQIRPHRAA